MIGLFHNLLGIVSLQRAKLDEWNAFECSGDQFLSLLQPVVIAEVCLVRADDQGNLEAILVRISFEAVSFLKTDSRSSLTSTNRRIRSAFDISPRVVLKALRIVGCMSSMNPMESMSMKLKLSPPLFWSILLANVDRVVNGPSPVSLCSADMRLKNVVFPLCV